MKSKTDLETMAFLRNSLVSHLERSKNSRIKQNEKEYLFFINAIKFYTKEVLYKTFVVGLQSWEFLVQGLVKRLLLGSTLIFTPGEN